VKLKDIGLYLKERIETYFKAQKIPYAMRYFDPSYSIRGCPPDAEDSILCDLYARHAVHAAMTGRTGLIIGMLHDNFVHIPIDLLSGAAKQVDASGSEWQSVLACTGQPPQLR